MDLAGADRVAIVTGGSRGIGRAVAQRLSRQKIRVAVVARGRGRLTAAAEAIAAATGTEVMALPADVRDDAAVRGAVDRATEAWGGVHILVNCAGEPGGTSASRLSELDDQTLLADFDTKFLGYLRFARACAPHMAAAGWGRIINIGGLSARSAGNYTSGFRNLALGHVTKTMAMELGRSGITVNVVHPGTVRTEDWLERRGRQLGMSAAEYEDQAARRTAIGRVVEVDEVAEAVAFLASDAAGAITGEVIAVAGGAGEGITV